MRRRRRRRGLDNEQEGVALAPAASKIDSATSEANPLISMQQLIGNKATGQFLQRALSEKADSGDSNLVTGMQQLIGNKATTQFLQRALNPGEADDSTVALKPGDPAADTDSEGETVGAPANVTGAKENLLTPQQVDRAMFFYAADPQKYTPDLIARIQTEVGASPGGTMDRETVQAVARHQAANPPLKVDGMAGPRTLPAVFRQGLDNPQAEEKAVKQGKFVTKAQWIVKDTADQRLELLQDEANATLKDAKVPELGKQMHKQENRPLVFFFNEPWVLLGFRERMDNGFIHQEELNELLMLTYREARRAEQVFSMARMLAGIGKTAVEISTALAIPVDKAAPALDAKLKPGTPEFVVADGWFQAVFGTSGAKHDAINKEFFEASDELKAAQDAFNRDKSPENGARLAVAQKRFEEAKKAREDLPDEQDANRVSRNFEEVQKKLGEPPDR